MLIVDVTKKLEGKVRSIAGPDSSSFTKAGAAEGGKLRQNMRRNRMMCRKTME
jgi:hypothetical protein